MSNNKSPSFHSSSSKLVLIMGPMFSGKTSTLISELTRYVDVDIPVVYINSSEDTRGEFISTHNSSFSTISSKIKTIKSQRLDQISESVLNEHGVIAVDEAQFFSDLVPFVIHWMEKEKMIYIAGLDGDMNQKIFGDIVHLIPYASEVRKLNAVCESCRTNGKIVSAPFTIRHQIDLTDKKLIGGKDLYHPVCSDCMFSFKNKYKKHTILQVQRDQLESINYII
jgi:thymidine kinase